VERYHHHAAATTDNENKKYIYQHPRCHRPRKLQFLQKKFSGVFAPFFPGPRANCAPQTLSFRGLRHLTYTSTYSFKKSVSTYFLMPSSR
jgi:hypothetical protein